MCIWYIYILYIFACGRVLCACVCVRESAGACMCFIYVFLIGVHVVFQFPHPLCSYEKSATATNNLVLISLWGRPDIHLSWLISFIVYNISQWSTGTSLVHNVPLKVRSLSCGHPDNYYTHLFQLPHVTGCDQGPLVRKMIILLCVCCLVSSHMCVSNLVCQN